MFEVKSPNGDPFLGGDDIVLDLQINVAQAALGDELTVPTVDGDTPLSVPGGTQSGRVFRLRGLGVPKLDRSGRGANVCLLYTSRCV